MKKKIYNYDFLIVGAGLIGSLAALALHQKKFKVLAVDKQRKISQDNRTLAVNANSKDFLNQIGIWSKLKSKPKPINKIIIKDYINKYPLIFENNKESMGNVVFNKEVLLESIKACLEKKILISNYDLDYNNLPKNNIINIKNKTYSFKKIILSVGKNVKFNSIHETQDKFYKNYQLAHVGFFTHSKVHNNTAYEIFTKNGPLAVLPSPYKNNLKSTFIYSSKQKITNNNIKSLIKKNFINSHGKIIFDKNFYDYPIIVKINKDRSNYILLGDALKSIHPVAGQGWNLGIRDIQTLCKLTNQFSLESNFINQVYFARRFTESMAYLSFTSSLNFLYENLTPLTKNIVKFGYQALYNSRKLKNIFIKQAMGRINLID